MLVVPSQMPTLGGMRCSPRISNNPARSETTSSSPTAQATLPALVPLAPVETQRSVMMVEMTTYTLKSQHRCCFFYSSHFRFSCFSFLRWSKIDRAFYVPLSLAMTGEVRIKNRDPCTSFSFLPGMRKVLMTSPSVEEVKMTDNAQ